MSAVDRTITCRKHGKAQATYVCQHLVRGEGLGFFCADAPDDPYPDAWCSKCEEMRVQHGGSWAEANEQSATVTLVCHFCYEAARERNKQA